MPYNLRQRYNLRDRGPTQQGRPPTRRKGQQKAREAKQHPKPTRKGPHRDARRQHTRDTAPSPAAAHRDKEQQQQQPPPSSVNDEIDQWYKEMGFEEVAFIPDPEAGLKEGEEPPPPEMEEDDPVNSEPWPDLGLEITQAGRDAAKRDPFIAAWVRSWDRMHAPRA